MSSVPEKPHRSASSPDMVVEAILTGLRSGQLAPGQRLVEADLSYSLKVSRGPIREALKRLSAEGIVTLNKNRGAYIRSLSRKEVSDLLLVIEVVMGLVVRLATPEISSGDKYQEFARVSAELMAFERRDDSLSFLEKRREFYDILIQASNNFELKRLLPLMQIHLIRLQFQARLQPSDRAKQFDDYRAITKAVLAGDVARAERLTKLHVRRTRTSILHLPKDAFGLGAR